FLSSFFQYPAHHRALHSFPTRRSSDLAPAAWETPSDVLLERHETRAAVRRCIDRLPERYRTVLLLRDIEDLDIQETAAHLAVTRSEEHTSELQSRFDLVCRLLLEKKKK